MGDTCCGGNCGSQQSDTTQQTTNGCCGNSCTCKKNEQGVCACGDDCACVSNTNSCCKDEDEEVTCCEGEILSHNDHHGHHHHGDSCGCKGGAPLELSVEQIAKINILLGDIDDEDLETGNYDLTDEQAEELNGILFGKEEG